LYVCVIDSNYVSLIGVINAAGVIVFGGDHHVISFAEVELKGITIEVGYKVGEVSSNMGLKFGGVGSAAVQGCVIGILN